MPYTKLTWAARLRQYANRLRLTPAAGGAAVDYDVDQIEGTITQAGSAVSPANMQNIENALDSLRTFPTAGGTGNILTLTAYHSTLTNGCSVGL